jgi:hypothetical protein
MCACVFWKFPIRTAKRREFEQGRCDLENPRRLRARARLELLLELSAHLRRETRSPSSLPTLEQIP